MAFPKPNRTNLPRFLLDRTLTFFSRPCFRMPEKQWNCKPLDLRIPALSRDATGNISAARNSGKRSLARIPFETADLPKASKRKESPENLRGQESNLRTRGSKPRISTSRNYPASCSSCLIWYFEFDKIPSTKFEIPMLQTYVNDFRSSKNGKVGVAGFEPAISRSRTGRIAKLSHTPEIAVCRVTSAASSPLDEQVPAGFLPGGLRGARILVCGFSGRRFSI